MAQPNSRLIFEVATPRYLGSADARSCLLDLLSALPPRLAPTRCRSSASSKKFPLSLEATESLRSLVPGNAPYEGDVTLYRPEGPFEVAVVWRCGHAEWFGSLDKKPFNTMLLCFAEGAQALADSALVETLTGLWLKLCQALSAAYGYGYLEDPVAGAQPRGEGLCLPRLHWRTFFSPEYSSALALSAAEPSAVVQTLEHGVLLSVASAPEVWMRQTPAEQQLIEALGAPYFWREGDSWRRPRGPYLMPALDWSELIEEEKRQA